MSEIIASTYELIEQIGSGGGGIVYLANHLRLNKKVVLKADKRSISANPVALRREVDIMKDLTHSYIPKVYDFFVEDETVYTVMDYIDGESLDKKLKRGEKIPQPIVIKWAKQLLSALEYLHSPTHGDPPKGFVHSDIKPANIMITPYNNVCLIDFNIALAIGETSVIGCSAGYASPEHYGLDYSFDSEYYSDNDATIKLTPESEVSSSSDRKIIPDVRSDIYSLGATIYHLLCGRRPERDARLVTPLTEKETTPLLSRIIAKAMNPNPDLRYQTASEMLKAFQKLFENDDRIKRHKRKYAVLFAISGFLSVAGIFSAFVGLKRMENNESRLKLSEYSINALEEGDVSKAIDMALKAASYNSGLFSSPPPPEAQSALSAALNIYDLSDGYKSFCTVSLPSAPLGIEISPDGETAALLHSEKLTLYDINSQNEITVLPVAKSSLCEVEFLDNDIIIYAGDTGITAYNIKTGRALWTGMPATAVSISADKSIVAAVYKEEHTAYVYNVGTGNLIKKIDFGEKHQSVAVNDSFANPCNCIFSLNEKGTRLAVSFSDGSLFVYDLEKNDAPIEILGSDYGFNRYEGGFYKDYLAFSAQDSNGSAFSIVDCNEFVQTGGFMSEDIYSVKTDENGIYVQTDNILVKIDPLSGEQTPLVNTSENISCFATDKAHTVIASGSKSIFFSDNAEMIAGCDNEFSVDFLVLRKGTALIGSRSSNIVRVMKYEAHKESELFSYDPSYFHDEARISADGKTMMLFSYLGFRIYDNTGNVVNENILPDPEQIYDQQFMRESDSSFLKVIYYNGEILTYNAKDGSLSGKEQGEKPDPNLYEVFYTDSLRIESPLHGTPVAYNRKTGEKVAELKSEAYLTYITQVGELIIAQYTTADNEHYNYGVLMNDKCQPIADLPYLCDIYDSKLVFDYPTGNLRTSRIYTTDELLETAQKYKEENWK